MSSASDLPTREVILRRGVSCFRDWTSIREAGLAPGFEVTVGEDCSLDSWLVAVLVSMDSVGREAVDWLSVVELVVVVVVVSTLLDWGLDSWESGMESWGLDDWESD